MAHRSGFVTIIGRPNAGKSTLLNALVGEKIAIVTEKPQTTRMNIQGILNVKAQRGRPAAQIVFVDTPGVHKPDSRLNRKMMQEIHAALEQRDLILLLVDATEKFGPGDEQVLDLVKRAGAPAFLLLNKVDKLHKEKLLPIIEHYSGLYPFPEIIPISALKRDGVDRLIDNVAAALPAGPPLFPEDQLTDQPERFTSSSTCSSAGPNLSVASTSSRTRSRLSSAAWISCIILRFRRLSGLCTPGVSMKTTWPAGRLRCAFTLRIP